MSLYTIMVVDDEEEIRLGIIKKIPWEEYGFKVVGDAENGQEALEKAEKLRPDIVMTDIKMPFMDGLELGRELTKKIPESKIIIFSGSDDFEYAQKAIKINVIEYVLKPINSNELIEILKRLKVKLDKEYNDKINLESLHNHYLESLPILREQFLASVIEGRQNKTGFISECDKLGVDLKSKHLAISIIEAENEEDNCSNLENREEHIINISIKKLLEEEMNKYCKTIAFIYYGKVIGVLLFDKKEHIKRLIEGLTNFSSLYKKILGIKVSIGVGNIVNSPYELNRSYIEAQDAVNYKFLFGTGKVIYIEDVEPDKYVELKFTEQDERKLLDTIKVAEESAIKELISKLFKKTEEVVLDLDKYKIYLLEINIAMIKLIQSYNLDISDIYGEGFNPYSIVEDFNSLEEAKKWVIDKAIKINLNIGKERKNSSKLLVEKAKDYINNNFADYDLSVEKLCDYLHVSPTYFSTIFKRETEMNFVNYLTSVRLEEALRLLKTTDDKTYIIASKVGYQEANYFSYVFKRKYGIAPSRYRRN